jgi:hypothetical protein
MNISGLANEVPAGSAGSPSIYPTGDTNTGIFFPAADTIAFTEGGAEAMRIDSSGNVGIGTSSPSASYKLDVSGSVGASGSVTIGTSGTYAAGSIYSDANWGMIFRAKQASPAQADFKWGNSADTERMRIDASGNLLVGTTTALSNARAIFYSNAAGNAPFEARNLLATAGKYWFFGPDTSSAFTIGNQSSVGVKVTDGATSWSSLSDERSKTNLKKIENGIEKVVSLRAVTGRYVKDDENASRAFLIAQDVLQVLPEAVDQTNPNELSLRYTEVIPLLTAAIQEQQQMIQALQADIAALKGV